MKLQSTSAMVMGKIKASGSCSASAILPYSKNNGQSQSSDSGISKGTTTTAR